MQTECHANIFFGHKGLLTWETVSVGFYLFSFVYNSYIKVKYTKNAFKVLLSKTSDFFLI